MPVPHNNMAGPAGRKNAHRRAYETEPEKIRGLICPCPIIIWQDPQAEKTLIGELMKPNRKKSAGSYARAAHNI